MGYLRTLVALALALCAGVSHAYTPPQCGYTLPHQTADHAWSAIYSNNATVGRGSHPRAACEAWAFNGGNYTYGFRFKSYTQTGPNNGVCNIAHFSGAPTDSASLLRTCQGGPNDTTDLNFTTGQPFETGGTGDPSEDLQVICQSANCTVTIKHELSAETLTPERVADYMSLFAAFLLAAVVVLCAKALYNRFRIDHDHA